MSISSAATFTQHQNGGQFDVPEIGGGVGFIDQQKEKTIGEKVYRQVQQQMPVLHDPWLEDQFMMVFSRILSQTQLGQPVGLVLIKDSQINAFAVPGGLFALNTGMVTASNNIDEVASVMGHEIAHVTQRHYSRSQEAFKGQGLLALAGIIVGAALASKADGDVGGAVMMGTQAALMDKQLSYSRNQEREADRIGMQFMYGAGYDPESMADFFEIMHRATSQLSFLPDFWLTHPLTTERMSEARLRANQFPKVTTHSSQQEFDIIKWYTLVVSGQANDRQLMAFARKNNFPGLLALSEFYLLQGDYDNAQSQLNLAKQINPDHTLVSLIQTNIYLGRNKIDDAYQTIITKQRITPENRALSYKLAEVYLRQNKPKEAEQLVNRFVSKNNKDIIGWQLLQQAANLDKQNPMRTVNVLRNRAEAQYWTGDEENAIKSLLHAKRLAKENNAMSARIETRLKVMQDERKMKI
ncbi:M48 family metalloprotease [Acinetobacter bereziniae]|uniref:M48 family metalloprotease n=1 Tax=uncultured Acinetobacter sp. TaxID=165433 RepID=UPI001D171B83|nr:MULTISPECIES: M48 family metalloprotease [Acinetobacter]MDG3557209.1 M48 family metalloprotease [Acinetobacter bereziniae]MDP6001450.1 M48 family metalloprotease [Acinetobacter bereziniae]MDQ9820626.1 M48 family metalloprotease [Acinetobacter bereziniae]UUN95763.1 M48 family metalloprotease [Acinetobacter bereziniae]WEI24800.1 M48 family metalloprotease [Acinetobacter bereziniae]